MDEATSHLPWDDKDGEKIQLKSLNYKLINEEWVHEMRKNIGHKTEDPWWIVRLFYIQIFCIWWYLLYHAPAIIFNLGKTRPTVIETDGQTDR